MIYQTWTDQRASRTMTAKFIDLLSEDEEKCVQLVEDLPVVLPYMWNQKAKQTP